ncbi:LysR family transcriptional regulator [Pigmentiphaga soli]|uniref:LysR family transcriptional regulator n=1 Tax=Pigmentiphaga soli TaxID=1007095 RepID=A0ABP8H208_9BURK
MEIRQVQYFLCLYEERSVTRAARRLNIVQPALSMQIARLENELGQQLFLRTKRGVEPTAEGRQMYRLFLPILGDFTRAREQMMNSSGELTGQVRVGTVASISQGVLVGALLEFSAAHPKVGLMLTDGYSGGLADAVAGTQLDAAITNKPRRSLSLNTEVIVEEDLVLITGLSHPALPPEVPFRHLSSLRMALPTRQHGLRLIIENFAQAEEVDLSPAVEIDSIGTILRLVHESDFATLLPRIAVRRLLRRPAYRCHAIVSPVLRRQLVCVTHPRNPVSVATSAFLAVLTRHIREAAEGATEAIAATGAG